MSLCRNGWHGLGAIFQKHVPPQLVIVLVGNSPEWPTAMIDKPRIGNKGNFWGPAPLLDGGWTETQAEFYGLEYLF